MITSEKELKENKVGQYLIEKEFFKENAKGSLLEWSDKFNKGVVIIDQKQFDELKKQIELSKVRSKAGKSGGRPRLPELTESEIEMLSPEDKIRYRNRIWQRQKRERDANNKV